MAFVTKVSVTQFNKWTPSWLSKAGSNKLCYEKKERGHCQREMPEQHLKQTAGVDQTAGAHKASREPAQIQRAIWLYPEQVMLVCVFSIADHETILVGNIWIYHKYVYPLTY